jgi:UDP:flavonoid glycosyltransferase YjiC (YdhE family)
MRALWFVASFGRGHVARCRPLIANLIERGHDCRAVVFGRAAADLMADTCPVIRPAPGTVARAPMPVAPPAYTLLDSFEMVLTLHQRDFGDPARRTMNVISEAIDDFRPDVAVVDQVAYVGPIARARGVPVVQVTQGPYVPGHPSWTSWMPARPPGVSYPSPLASVNASFASVGVPPLARLDDMLDGDCLLMPTVEALGTTEGAIHIDAHDSLPPSPLDVRALTRVPGSPLVVVTYSTAAHLTDEVVSAVAAAGAQAVAIDTERMELPTAARWDGAVRRMGIVDTTDVFPHADFVVHHGGAGTSMACLRSGVPSIAIPTQTEQERNARALERLGVGLYIPVSDEPMEELAFPGGFVSVGHRRTSRLRERLAEAFERIVRPEYREAAQDARSLVSRLPGRTTGADVIEELGSGTPRSVVASAR